MVTKLRSRDVATSLVLSPIAPVIVGAALRLLNLGGQDLWYDEAVTAWIARLPWPRLLAAIAGDVHPPLWYAIEKVTVSLLGNSEFALRLPAALLSIVALALIPRLSLSLLGRGAGARVGVISTWLMALSPFQIAYAQEARMYALLLVAVELAALGAFTRRWTLYTLGAVLALYSHNIGLVYVGCLALVTLVTTRLTRSARLLSPILANAAAGLLYAPWAWVTLRQAQAVGASFWVQRPSAGAIPLALHQLFWHTIPPAWLGTSVALLSGLALVAMVVGFRGLGFGSLATLAFAPLLLTWLVSQFKPVLVYRLMIGCTPFMSMLLAHAFVSHPRSRWLAVAAAPVLAFVLAGWYVNPEMQKGDLSRFVAPVQAQYQSRDAVLHTCIASYILVSYYSPNLNHYLWKQANDLSQSLTDQTKQAMNMRETTIEELFASGYRRVFVYYSDAPITSQVERDETARIKAAYGVVWDRTWTVTIEKSDLIESGVYLVKKGD